MLGLLIIIVISWGLLYRIQKKHITVLGVIPTPNRTLQFFIGLILIVIILLINIYIQTLLEKIEWHRNQINYSSLWNAFVYHFRSALTEDLVFRGAILYILIQRIGAMKGILLSAICFGIYHWFSYGVLDEGFIFLTYVFLVTGFAGYVWGYAFYKTKSILIALGLHTGFNLTMSCFFESQPYGELLFSIASKTDLTHWSGFFFSFFKGLFPSAAMLLCVKLLLKTNLFHSKANNHEINPS